MFLPVREIHHGVGAPFRCPTHLLDFFFDRRRHRAVADVGVDFHQEIAADDHRLGLGVIDVGGNDRSATGDFVPHVLRCYFIRDTGPKPFSIVLISEIVAGGFRVQGSGFRCSCADHVLAQRNEFHLGRNDAVSRIIQLSHGATVPSRATVFSNLNPET